MKSRSKKKNEESAVTYDRIARARKRHETKSLLEACDL